MTISAIFINLQASNTWAVATVTVSAACSITTLPGTRTPFAPIHPADRHGTTGRATDQFLFRRTNTVHAHVVWVAVYTRSISADPTAATTCNVALAPFWPSRPVTIHWTLGRTTDWILFRRTNTVHTHVVWVTVYTSSVSAYPTAATTRNVALAPFWPSRPVTIHWTLGRTTDWILFRRTNTVHTHVVWVTVYTSSVSAYPTAATTWNVTLAPFWPSWPVAIHWTWGKTTNQSLFMVSGTIHTHVVGVTVYTSSISADPTAATTCNAALTPFWPSWPVAIHWTWCDKTLTGLCRVPTTGTASVLRRGVSAVPISLRVSCSTWRATIFPFFPGRPTSVDS